MIGREHFLEERCRERQLRVGVRPGKTAAKTKIEKQNKSEFEVWNKECFLI